MGTPHAGVLFMSAVVFSPLVMRAFVDIFFISWTNQVVKPNRSASFAMSSVYIRLYGFFEAKLSAKYVGFGLIPLMATDGPPFTIVEHFHSALTWVRWVVIVVTHSNTAIGNY